MHGTTVCSNATMKVVYVTKCNIKEMICVYMCVSESHMCRHILVNNRRRKVGDGGHILCMREAL